MFECHLCGCHTNSNMGMNIMWTMSDTFQLLVIIDLCISLLCLLPVETHIRGWMLNCCALVMFNMLMLSTSCGFGQYRLFCSLLFESCKSFMVRRSALLLVSWSIFWQAFLVLKIVLVFTFPVLTFNTKQLLIVSKWKFIFIQSVFQTMTGIQSNAWTIMCSNVFQVSSQFQPCPLLSEFFWIALFKKKKKKKRILGITFMRLVSKAYNTHCLLLPEGNVCCSHENSVKNYWVKKYLLCEVLSKDINFLLLPSKAGKPINFWQLTHRNYRN